MEYGQANVVQFVGAAGSGRERWFDAILQGDHRVRLVYHR